MVNRKVAYRYDAPLFVIRRDIGSHISEPILPWYDGNDMKEKRLAAVLDNIRSVHNVGSIFRTADGAGFSEVVLCGVTPGPTDRLGRLRPDFAKVALGAEQSLPWRKERTVGKAISRLRKEGFFVIALEQSLKSVPYTALPKRMPDKIALIVGSETRGIQPRTVKRADRILEIPMKGEKESLNVSVAFGIAAYECARRQRKNKLPRRKRCGI